MKKFALVLLTLTFVISTTLFLTACGEKDFPETSSVEDSSNVHKHAYSDLWSYDSDYHWHAATCEHTVEISDKSAHNFVDNVCSTCGYDKDATPAEYFTFTLLSDNTYEISAKDRRNLPSEIVIPSSYNGKPVTSIGRYAFFYYSGLTSITIPNSITSIGECAFDGCSNLKDNKYDNAYYLGNSSNPYLVLIKAKSKDITTCEINSETKFIHSYAFENCRGLTSITIPNSVTSIGGSAFENCRGLTSITIPNSVTSIGYSAFYNCSVTGVYITDLSAWCNISFGNEYSNPLYHAKNLYLNNVLITELEIPSNVTSIGDFVFSGCTGLTSITIPNSVTSIGNKAFLDCWELTSVTIPNSVTSICESAFYNCNELTSITIPNSVTSIGSSTFYKCSGLTSVTIGNSVTSIGNNAFSGCSGLENIIVSNGNTEYHSEGNCIIETATKTLILGCKNSIIPTDGSVTSIGSYAFDGCSGLTSVTIGNSVTSIGRYAFAWCSGLTSVTIGNSVTSIGEYAFYNCKSLTSVTIGNSVTSIGEYAFYNCWGLTSVTIPNSVTSFGSGAFDRCSNLKYNKYDNAYYLGNSSNPYLVLIKAKSEDITTCEINSATKFIHSSAFEYCSRLTSITIPNSVTSIGDSAFLSCSGLTRVYITDITAWCHIYFADEYANPLYYAKNLYLNNVLITELEIPSDVTSIGEYAFYKCSGLTSVTIGNGVTSIGNSAFYGCKSLTSITIPDSVTSIGRDAFYYCSSLTSVTFENTTGWWVSQDSTATSGTTISSDDLSNPSTAATYFTSTTYYNYYWKRS